MPHLLDEFPGAPSVSLDLTRLGLADEIAASRLEVRRRKAELRAQAAREAAAAREERRHADEARRTKVLEQR